MHVQSDCFCLFVCLFGFLFVFLLPPSSLLLKFPNDTCSRRMVNFKALKFISHWPSQYNQGKGLEGHKLPRKENIF